VALDLFARVKRALEATYSVDRELGVGGTAAVYLAHDRKHDRSVALKVLLPQIAATLGAERFLREIRLAARLSHPHILPLLDSGEADGLPFYVMPFIDGESLRDRLVKTGRLPIETAVAMARDAGDALDYAHAANIVHRDIKPENILLFGDRAVVADFGIARAIHSASDADITYAGMAVGTPAYMSPEQAAGESNVDGRTDIYSLASVLYEMLVGEPPFTGPNIQAVIARRFIELPARLRTRREDVPAHVDEAVAIALSRDPADRQSTITEFTRAILALPVGAPVPVAGVTPPAGGAATGSQPVRAPSVAVLPFKNLSPDRDNEYFCDGVTEEIIGALSKLRNLRVAAPTSSFAFKGKDHSVREIAERLNVSTIVEGSVRKAGNRVRINAQLVDVLNGYQLWSERFDRELDDIFAIQDDIAHAIASTLEVKLFGDSSRVSVADATSNRLAHEEYLKGRFFLNKRSEDGLRRAVEQFTVATREDPAFALAHSGLADTYTVLAIYGARSPHEAMPLAKRAAEVALELDPTLAAALVTLGVERAVYEWDWTGAGDAFRRALAIRPRYPTAHQWYAMNYLVPLGRFDEAIAAIDRASALDPLATVIGATVGVVHYFARDFEKAIEALQRILDIEPAFAIGHYFLATVHRDAGNLPLAEATFERAIGISGGTPEMIAGLAQTKAKRGAMDAARRLLAGLEGRARERHVSPALLGQVYAALGEPRLAMDQLHRARDARDPDLIFLGVRPAYDALRGESEFRALRQDLGLPAPGTADPASAAGVGPSIQTL